MGAITHLRSPGFSISRAPGRRLPPRHERRGSAPPEQASVVPRPAPSSLTGVTDRDIEARRASDEARERIGVNDESPWDRLQRILLGPALIQITQNPSSEHLTVSLQLKETFGGDYRPRDGITLALRTPEGTLGLKVDWSMVWVHTPSSVSKDMRSVFFLKAALPPTLLELRTRVQIAECALVMGFRGKRRELPIGALDLAPKPF